MRRDHEPPKPRRRFSKRITVAVIGWAMALPVLTLFVQPDAFGAALTASVPTIATAFTAYMGTGHADYRVRNNQPSYTPEPWHGSAMSPGVPMNLSPMEAGHDRAG